MWRLPFRMHFSVPKADTHIWDKTNPARHSKTLDEICYDVELEPRLQQLEGESFVNKSTTTEEEAKLDMKANVP